MSLRRIFLTWGAPSAVPTHVELEPGPSQAGRGPGSAIKVRSSEVSSRHARFLRLGDAVFVEDLGSTNGTRLNGTPVVGQTRVREGDLVQMGNVAFAVFSTGGSDDDTATDTDDDDDARVMADAIGGVDVEVTAAGDDPLAFALPGTALLSFRLDPDGRGPAPDPVSVWLRPRRGGWWVARIPGAQPAVVRGGLVSFVGSTVAVDEAWQLGPLAVRLRPSPSRTRTAFAHRCAGGTLSLLPPDPDLVET